MSGNDRSDDDKPLPLAERCAELARLTPARIALGRSGASLPTREVLRFGLAHAQARDAVHMPFRPADIAAELAALGLDTIMVESAARSREDYLRRPDLGRSLSEESRAALEARKGDYDLALVVADGLSSTAVHQNAAPLVAALLPLLRRQGLKLAPIVIARQARVALGDEIGQHLGARAVAGADRRAARPLLAGFAGRLSHLRAAPRPAGRRAQLHLEHPPGRARCREGGLQARLAGRRGVPPLADGR